MVGVGYLDLRNAAVHFALQKLSERFQYLDRPVPSGEGRQFDKGPFINSVTRVAAFFGLNLSPFPLATHTHPRHVRCRPFSVYFEPASRSKFSRDLPPPLVTPIYE